MKIKFALGLLVLFLGCTADNSNVTTNSKAVVIKERILPPEGYEWIIEDPNSFGKFLQNSPVKKEGSQILDFYNKAYSNEISFDIY